MYVDDRIPKSVDIDKVVNNELLACAYTDVKRATPPFDYVAYYEGDEERPIKLIVSIYASGYPIPWNEVPTRFMKMPSDTRLLSIRIIPGSEELISSVHFFDGRDVKASNMLTPIPNFQLEPYFPDYMQHFIEDLAITELIRNDFEPVKPRYPSFTAVALKDSKVFDVISKQVTNLSTSNLLSICNEYSPSNLLLYAYRLEDDFTASSVLISKRKLITAQSLNREHTHAFPNPY